MTTPRLIRPSLSRLAGGDIDLFIEPLFPISQEPRRHECAQVRKDIEFGDLVVDHQIPESQGHDVPRSDFAELAAVDSRLALLVGRSDKVVEIQGPAIVLKQEQAIKQRYPKSIEKVSKNVAAKHCDSLPRIGRLHARVAAKPAGQPTIYTPKDVDDPSARTCSRESPHRDSLHRRPGASGPAGQVPCFECA